MTAEIDLAQIGDWYRTTRWIAFGDGNKFRSEILSKTNGVCAYCGELEATTIDHIIPLSKKGARRFHNLIGACEDCNCAKADLSLEEFRDRFFAGKGGLFYFESRSQ